MPRKTPQEPKGNEKPVASTGGQDARRATAEKRKNGGWQEIEARREKAALKASLADVWDEDFDLDEEILAELDHTAEFFTQQEESEQEEIFDEDGEIDEYFDDDEP